MIFSDISAERHRQQFLQSVGKFDRGFTDATLSDPERLGILAEEFGEVARVVADHIAKPGAPLDRSALREELIQVAACCVGWIEYLDGQG